jgi:hypothetical protein
VGEIEEVADEELKWEKKKSERNHKGKQESRVRPLELPGRI